MNPWTRTALADYEGHMGLPAIGQAALLAAAFQRAVAEARPRSVALLGCAGGNGLDALCGAGLERVVCVDVNPDYLAVLHARYATRLANLECHAGEMETFRSPAPVDLVFGGLVLEYTRLPEAVASVADLLAAGGQFHAWLQRPAAGLATVSPSPFAAALASVGEYFHYVDEADLIRLAQAQGLRFLGQQVETLPSGKSFAGLRFARVGSAAGQR